MQFLADVFVPCEHCDGTRFKPQVLEVQYRGRRIDEVLQMTVREALSFFSTVPKVVRRLQVLDEIGLGYLQLGQPATTLSGGEAQRIKIASHLTTHVDRTLYILDEPTTGLHFDDIAKLLTAFRKLIQAGHTLLVIEHNVDVIKTADWIVDLGPEGGEAGGELVVAGPPEAVAAHPTSHTGRYLRPALAAGLLVTASHAPLGIQVLARGIVFIDLAVAQIAGLGVVLADALGYEPHGAAVQAAALGAALAAALFFGWTERRWPQASQRWRNDSPVCSSRRPDPSNSHRPPRHAHPSRGFIRHRTSARSTTTNVQSTAVGTRTSANPPPDATMRRDAIWNQRAGVRPPISRTGCGMNSYGIIMPESTNEGRMKNTEMNTACADVRAMAETSTPTASDATMNGSATTKSVRRLPFGQ